MKKRLSLLLCLLLSMLLVLSGCRECEHQWNDATCELAKTCTLCGATDGISLGHIWKDADCITPRTCTVCAAVQGDALGHTWQPATCTEKQFCVVCKVEAGEPAGHTMKEANFQEPATCTICNYMEGNPLDAAYAGYPIEVIDVQLGVTYSYKAACYIKGYTTVGELTWEDYRIFDGDETHEAVEGYVWHSVTVKIVFSDRDAQRYGFIVQSALDDYHWIASENENGYTDKFAVSFYGQIYDQCLMANCYGSVSEWLDGSCTYTAQFAWRVPVGYDSHLILFYNAEADLGELLKNGDPFLLAFRFTE